MSVGCALQDEPKTGVILLARMSSKRFAGKILRTLCNGKSVLEFILSRVKETGFEVVLATSNDPTDDVLCNKASELGISIYRGSLNNVAERFFECAKVFGFDYAFRINGDNVFTDPKILCEVHSKVLADHSDFGTNLDSRTFPVGMSVELLKVDFYESILSKIVEVNHQEHVTSWLYAHPTIGKRSYVYNKKYPKQSKAKLALDTFDDFERINDILLACKQKGITPEFSNIHVWAGS